MPKSDLRSEKECRLVSIDFRKNPGFDDFFQSFILKSAFGLLDCATDIFVKLKKGIYSSVSDLFSPDADSEDVYHVILKLFCSLSFYSSQLKYYSGFCKSDSKVVASFLIGAFDVLISDFRTWCNEHFPGQVLIS